MATDLEEFCQNYINSKQTIHVDLSEYETLYIRWGFLGTCELCEISPNEAELTWRIGPLCFSKMVIFDNQPQDQSNQFKYQFMDKVFDVKDQNDSDYIMFLYEMFTECFWRK